MNENLPEAHLAYADYVKYNEWNWDAVGRSISKALQLNPGYADAHSAYGNYLRSVGRYENALKYAEKASALDPLSVNLLNNLANNYVFIRDFDRAEKTYLEALKINPASKPTQYEFAYMYCAKGDYQKAMEYAEEIINSGGKWLKGKHLMALIYKNTGRPEKTMEMLELYLTKIKSGETESDPWDLATLYTFNGDHVNAVRYLNIAADEKIGAVVLIKFAVSLLGLHNDNGFKALCARIGLK